MKKNRHHDWRLYDKANEKLRELGLYPSLLYFRAANRSGEGTHWVDLMAGPQHPLAGRRLDCDWETLAWGPYESGQSPGERRAVQLVLLRTLYEHRDLRPKR